MFSLLLTVVRFSPPTSFSAGFFMSRDGLAENCSCVFCTSTIPGGRMPREAMEGRSGECPGHWQLLLHCQHSLHPCRSWSGRCAPRLWLPASLYLLHPWRSWPKRRSTGMWERHYMPRRIPCQSPSRCMASLLPCPLPGNGNLPVVERDPAFSLQQFLQGNPCHLFAPAL